MTKRHAVGDRSDILSERPTLGPPKCLELLEDRRYRACSVPQAA